jgi:molybdate transport system substrate-binding protein
MALGKRWPDAEPGPWHHGCTQATEILSTPGVALVASLPPGCELATVYTAAVAARAASPGLARAMVAHLVDKESEPTRRRLGFI